MPLADRHYVIEKGHVVWSGSSDALSQQSEHVEQFLGV